MIPSIYGTGAQEKGASRNKQQHKSFSLTSLRWSNRAGYDESLVNCEEMYD